MASRPELKVSPIIQWLKYGTKFDNRLMMKAALFDSIEACLPKRMIPFGSLTAGTGILPMEMMLYSWLGR